MKSLLYILNLFVQADHCVAREKEILFNFYWILIYNHASHFNSSSFSLEEEVSDGDTIWAAADKTNKMTCVPSEDSDQPGHPPSLISLHCALNGYLRTKAFFMRTAKTLIKLGGCPGWSESLLGTHAISLVLSWCSSFYQSSKHGRTPSKWSQSGNLIRKLQWHYTLSVKGTIQVIKHNYLIIKYLDSYQILPYKIKFQKTQVSYNSKNKSSCQILQWK